MPAVMEAINRMSAEERVKTMEYLWAAMIAAAEPKSQPPSGCKWKTVLWWVLVGVFLAIVLAAFAEDGRES